eukprot:IDg10409t1
MLAVARHANAAGKKFCFNLSAPFLIQVPPFFAAMKELLPYVDVLFASETESAELAKAMEWDVEASDVAGIARLAALLPREGGAQRTVIFTQGSLPTIAAVAKEGKVVSEGSYPVFAIEADAIVDTNAAGDAFVGGYLSGLAKDQDMKECIAKGHYAAKVIIQHSGCTFPAKPDYQKA